MYKYNKGIKKIKYHEMVPEYLSKMLHNKKDNPIYGTIHTPVIASGYHTFTSHCYG